MTDGSYFLQISDVHVAPTDRQGNVTMETRYLPRGDEIIPPEGREYLLTQTPAHLAEAVREIECLDPPPAFVLMTGDQTMCGTRLEIERFLAIVEPLSMPTHYCSSSHDMNIEPQAFGALMGSGRVRFDHAGLRFFLMDVYTRPEGDRRWSSWRMRLREEHYAWLADGLSGWDGTAVLVTHAPILPLGEGTYADAWDGPETRRFVDFLAGTAIRWHISGHWHRNMTWRFAGITAINTGALAGFQCSGSPPFYAMPVRPGFRIFHWDGKTLRSHWHNLRAWIEAEIVTVGHAQVRGPRPQVCPAVVSGSATIRVEAYAPGTSVSTVEWGLARDDTVEGYRASPVMTGAGWRPMTRRWEGLWSEWETDLDAGEYEPGRYVMLTRTMREGDSFWWGHDAVPIGIERGDGNPTVRSEGERLFALFDPPPD